MANQRAQIVMEHDEIVEFLHQQRSATVATYGPSGQIHLVAMWYAVRDNTVWFETKSKSQKVLNLRRDPRMSFLVEAGHTYDQLRGVAMEGTGVVVEDPDVVWDVCVDIFERYNGEYSEEMKPFVEFMAKNRVVVRLDVARVRSWDHRKLGLPAMELGGSTAQFLE
ncbi:MAG TPA: PPOX class F420-dependent oxidoreductase [Nocardioides sp.]|uniref:pyridoxamine 5'-phosphate oxidase family protein n=1 Tax=uncultured Nocardioides sp. TaxID=198441 RepID=UPI000EF088DF|nr:PPOX class F420-dependent oxidoreductase [uncultured Nocardioides sp.]HCB05597.1 PPOX class F420-dependent oxidoreductase [Nocardioides sp.]HRD63248.1 PPOX class F420-dependent oxidoreductase [Nocardioides sp.]HRI95810.1 PPOX class F420-dependent oxidoreductase [Nocardioides sp.]HRK48598.1 PPOX class F420-dependent oxidoreductase [Nocardioides sp.]